MHPNKLLAALVFAAAAAHGWADDKLPSGFDPAAAWTDLQQQLLAQFDANRDGQLTGQELLLAQEAMRRHGINLGLPLGGFSAAEQFNKQFDRDGDGQLGPAEKMAAQAAYQRLRNSGKQGFRSGGVTRGGFPAPGPVLPAAAGTQKPDKISPLVKRFDKDGDGKLNDEEKAAAQAEFKKEKPKDAKATAPADKGKKAPEPAAEDAKKDPKTKTAPATKGK